MYPMLASNSKILLPQPPEGWDYRRAPPCPAWLFHFKRRQASHYLGDWSEHFFHVHEGNGYPSEEQDTWLAEMLANT